MTRALEESFVHFVGSDDGGGRFGGARAVKLRAATLADAAPGPIHQSAARAPSATHRLSVLRRRPALPRLKKHSQDGQVALVVALEVERGLKEEGGVREFRVARNAAQRFAADVA